MTKYVRHTDQPSSVDIRMCEGLLIKSSTFPRAGMIVPQHSHNADHISGISYGAVEVEKDGVSLGYFEAPSLIVIEAHSKHLFRVLMPHTTIWCIWATADLEDGEPVTHEEHHLDFQDEP